MQKTEGRRSWGHLLWVLAAGALGLAITAVFAGYLRLPRTPFVALYAATGGTLVCTYLHWSGLDLRQHLLHHWPWGLGGAAVGGALAVMNVVSQPASASPHGRELLSSLLSAGLIYGSADALLLTVLPVLATWQALSGFGWTRSCPGKIAAGVVALASSLCVTAVYHLGYPEFRGLQVGGPVLGNGILSLTYLLTASPLAPIGGHIAMHIAAVLHGPESTIQLPPHY
jgi:hypothetical protein